MSEAFNDNFPEKQQDFFYLMNQKEMVFHFLQKGEIIFVNDEFCNYFCNKREELIGSNFNRFIYKPDKELVKNQLFKLSKSNPEVNIEFRVITIDGRIRWNRWKKQAILNEKNQVVEIQCIGQDITEKKIAEIERQRLNKEVLEKNQDLEQIIYVASHDLRSPLVNIQGFSKEIEYTLKELKKICNRLEINLDEKNKILNVIKNDIPDSLQYIQKSVKRMDSILYGLLKLSRMERAVLNIIKLNINNLIADVLHNFEFLLKEKKINVEVRNLPACKGDPLQINQVFSNIIDNAIKYYHPERKNFIKISGRKKDQHIIYCIEDNGIGISENNLTKIFEIFCRINPDISEGEGLGLNIVKKILQRHGGKIWVESDEGKGSKFFISLPST
jgi:PAS domain S-box-containing protein